MHVQWDVREATVCDNLQAAQGVYTHARYTCVYDATRGHNVSE